MTVPNTLPVELERISASIAPPDAAATALARARQDSLTKPRGSLGRLEALSIQLAAATGCARPVTRPRSLILAAADHGVTAEGVSPYPSEVTAQMVANFLAGGAAANVLARQADAKVVILDVGVRGFVPATPNLVSRRVRDGTMNFAAGPAMSEENALGAIQAGFETASAEIDGGARLLATGDMGIGNTTASSALAAALLNLPVAQVTGRGAGLDDDRLRHKVETIERALALSVLEGATTLQVLARVGGLEIAALVGVIIAGATHRIPVVLDGFVSGAAALVAARMAPAALPYLIAGHVSVEPGHGRILEALQLEPLLDLDMRLGEGTGALLALHLVDAAANLLNEMATFSEAGVSARGSAD